MSSPSPRATLACFQVMNNPASAIARGAKGLIAQLADTDRAARDLAGRGLDAPALAALDSFKEVALQPYPEVLDEGEAGALAAAAAREAVLEVLDDKSIADLDALFHERSVELIEADMVGVAANKRLKLTALTAPQLNRSVMPR